MTTSASVGLAQQLHLQVTAEGIEKRSQLDALREAGCDFGQGFLFERPLPVPEVEQLILPASATRVAPDLDPTLAR